MAIVLLIFQLVLTMVLEIFITGTFLAKVPDSHTLRFHRMERDIFKESGPVFTHSAMFFKAEMLVGLSVFLEAPDNTNVFILY